jgi:hypothetical protein
MKLDWIEIMLQARWQWAMRPAAGVGILDRKEWSRATSSALGYERKQAVRAAPRALAEQWWGKI